MEPWSEAKKRYFDAAMIEIEIRRQYGEGGLPPDVSYEEADGLFSPPLLHAEVVRPRRRRKEFLAAALTTTDVDVVGLL